MMPAQDTARPAPTRLPFSYGYVIVAAAFCVMLVGLGFFNSFGVFFTPLVTEFGWSRALTSGSFSVASFMRGALGIVVGGITDRFGARVVVTVCGLLLAAGYLLMSRIDSAWQMYALYIVLIGTGMSGVWVPLLSTVAKWFTRRRSLMTGIVIAGLSIGTMVMPPVVNRLIATYEWRNAYLIGGGVTMVIFVLAAQFIRRKPAAAPPPPAVLRGLAEEMKTGTVEFSVRQAVDTRQFWLVGGIIFCTGFWRMATTVHIVPHLIDTGFSAASASNILAIMGGVGVVGSIIGGMAADRFGSRKAYLISFTLMLIASLWLLYVNAMWMLYPFAVIFGLGGGMNGPLMSPLIARIFGLRSHGAIFGAINASYTIGAALGPFLTGYFYDLSGSYQAAFIVSAGVSVAGFILALVLRPIHRTDAGL